MKDNDNKKEDKSNTADRYSLSNLDQQDSGTVGVKCDGKKRIRPEDIGGYKFAEGPVINMLSYLLGSDNEEAKKECKRILNGAEKIKDSDERGKYISDNVREFAKKKDNGLSQGFANICNDLVDGKKSLGDNTNGFASEIFKQLGIDVSPDNCVVNDSGPNTSPRCISIRFCPKPGKELTKEDSDINKLADLYKETLKDNEKSAFDEQWQKHKTNASKEGPLIDKEEFKKEADAKFNEWVKEEQNKYSVQRNVQTDKTDTLESKNDSVESAKSSRMKNALDAIKGLDLGFLKDNLENTSETKAPIDIPRDPNKKDQGKEK